MLRKAAAGSLFTLTLFIVVRVPVRYNKLIDEQNPPFTALQNAILEPLTIYYFVYSVLALVSWQINRWYGTFLLLDICVKDTTTADVLRAV